MVQLKISSEISSICNKVEYFASESSNSHESDCFSGNYIIVMITWSGRSVCAM